jgi:hypothetical protein
MSINEEPSPTINAIYTTNHLFIIPNFAAVNEADFLKMLGKQRKDKDKGSPMEAFQWLDSKNTGGRGRICYKFQKYTFI